MENLNYKLSFYVPESHLETVKAALFAAGAGVQGNYEQTCWQCLGQGQFFPIGEAEPAIGELNKLVLVHEYKVEMLCPISCINQAIAALKASHPYEEPAFEVLHLLEFQDRKSEWYNSIGAKKNSYEPLKTAVVHPVDELSLRGVIAATNAGFISPILIGPKQKIIAAAKESSLDISTYPIINTQHSQEAAETAVKMARKLEVEAIMKGKIHTDELMKPIIDKELGLRTGRRMSHVFSLEVANYQKPIFLTDAAINIAPNLNEKKDIVQNAIDLFHALNLGIPKVAILSAVETVNDKIPSTLDATALCKMAERGQITGAILDGPLAFDNAISVKSAHIKGIFSEVAGNADILVVPDVESGNMLYKQMTYLSGIEAAGIVLGATVPIILTSRGSDELSRKASAAMALLYYRKRAN